MDGRIVMDLFKVVQKDFNLVSYKLDYVAETFINDNINNNLKMQELAFDNEALKRQVKSLQQIIEKEGKILEDNRKTISVLRNKLNLENSEKCVICEYLKK